MSIVKNAVKESRDVARLAVDAAKNELIEQLTPEIKAIIDRRLRQGGLGADVAALREGNNRMRQAADGYSGITDFEEGTDMGKKKDEKDKMESVVSLFPDINEVAEVSEAHPFDDDGKVDMKEEEEMEEDAMPGQAHESQMTEEEEEEVHETLELSESELEEMYKEALQLEVDVSKGFKDIAKPHELGAGAKYNSFSEPASLEQLKGGEHDWDDERPPAKKDWIPEAKIQRLVKQGIAENQALVAQNKKLTEMVKQMHTKLQEMNLLNSKILHVNKFLANHRLTTEQKRSVIESIDKGGTVNEVRRIYSILEGTFRAVGALSESRAPRPRANAQGRRTSGTPNQKVLRESAGQGGDGEVSRWKLLAGLTKDG